MFQLHKCHGFSLGYYHSISVLSAEKSSVGDFQPYPWIRFYKSAMFTQENFVSVAFC